MILYDKNCEYNTYFSHCHNEIRTVNGLNRCNEYYIPHRNHIEIDDIISLRRCDNVSSDVKYIYQLPLRFYRIKELSIAQITQLFLQLLSTANLIDDINNRRCMLLFDEHAHPSILNDNLIYKIDICLKNIGIKKHVYIVTCNPFNKDIQSRLFKTIYYECYELIAKSLKYKSYTYDTPSAKKRFLCLNLRKRMHRYFLLSKLCQIKDFEKKSILSLKALTYEWLHEQPEYSYFKQQMGGFVGITKFIKKLPFMAGYDYGVWPCKIKGERGNIYGDTVPAELFNNGSVFIVTEKEYRQKERMLTLTEKTFKPISAKMPFIIYGQPGICKHLQSLGYKTFNTLWSEEYDIIHDPIQRGEKIVELVRYLNDLNEQDFTNILHSCNDIVAHNYNHMHKRDPAAPLIYEINNFLK